MLLDGPFGTSLTHPPPLRGSYADRPDPPASQPVVSQLTRESLVLSWTGPSYDGGKAVQGYIVEVRSEGSDWTKLATRCKSTSYHARSGLEPLGKYCFRVRAYNSAGISEPGQESEWVKMAATSKRFLKGGGRSRESGGRLPCIDAVSVCREGAAAA